MGALGPSDLCGKSPARGVLIRARFGKDVLNPASSKPNSSLGVGRGGKALPPDCHILAFLD